VWYTSLGANSIRTWK
jgi:hypothetical protein